jgi:general nucleoside transport system permease protein
VIVTPDVGDVLVAFWRGSLGTTSALISGTLVRAIPLSLLGIAVAVAFRGGVFNVGGEGQFLLGAVAAAVVGLQLNDAVSPLALTATLTVASLAGGAWAAIAALLRSRFGVLEVISTIMLNFIAVHLVSYLVRGPLQEPTGIYPQTLPIAEAARLPSFGGTRLHLGILLAVASSVAVWFIIARTAAGFRLRAVGASPSAAQIAGRVDRKRVAAAALISSGAIAGLAGGVEVAGVTYALYENISPGYGFAAIAVAILARLHPGGVLLSAFAFAALETGALGMQRDAGVPSVVATAAEAIMILVVLAWTARRRDWHWFYRAPAHGAA